MFINLTDLTKQYISLLEKKRILLRNGDWDGIKLVNAELLVIQKEIDDYGNPSNLRKIG